MNKIFKTMMLAAATVLGIASCENVPAPFIEPGQSDTEEVIDAKGSGTLADPFNVAGVINYVKELGADVESPGQVYIKGIVCSTEDISPQYKNATFKISDDVNSVKDAFTVYRAKGLKNQDIKSEDEVQVGDTIIVCGNVVNYKGNTPETVQNKAHIHWQKRGNKVLDGSATDTPDTPTDGGTWDKPYTVAQAIADQSGKEVWVRGYIVGSIPADASSTVMENMTFTADGANHTNLCIADSPEETNYANCAPVQLPSGSDARTNLNLKENPTMLGKEVWLKGKTMKYCGANGLKEISKYTLTAPTANDDEETGNTPAEGAKGDGSLENPFNAAGAHNYVTALPADEVTAEKFYIKGIVCESSKMDISTQYKNATFHISDDGTTNGTHFLIFRTKGLNGADITSEDDVKVGDEVVVYAKLVNYKGNTPETEQNDGIIYSQKRNGQDMGNGEENDTPSNAQGDGSLEKPYNLAAIWALYENGNAEGTSVHVKGIISQVKSLDVSKWERAQYFISDDGTENGQFQIYNGYYLNGQPFTANDQIKVGDEVIVYGELSSYNGTPQIGQNSKIVSINGQTGGSDTPDEGEEDTPTDDPSSTADWSQSMKDLYSDVVEGSVDAGTKTKDGVTITFEKNDGNNMPKYYFNNNEDFRAVRMYALNSMEIKSDKQISKIVLKCTSPSGDITYNGNRTSTVSSGNIAWANDNQTVTISDINSNTFSLVNEHEKNSGGVQYRIHSMEIFYSK